MLDRLGRGRPEKYAKFWEEFGALLKEGLVEDSANREKIAKLLRFTTTQSAGDAQIRSLKDYLADAKPEQQAIYLPDRGLADGGAHQPAPGGLHASAASKCCC